MRHPLTALRLVLTALAVLGGAAVASAQQRPLVTEDPECIGAGRMLIEGGVEYQRAVFYPVSGLEGNLWRVPTIGVSIGLSSIAELQIDGGFDRFAITSRRPAPLSNKLQVPGDHSHDPEDVFLATKIRLASETPGRPAVGLRFATRLPNASNETGIGQDVIEFYASLLAGKTVRSVRFVANGGFGILPDPTGVREQNDVVTYGVSIARAVSNSAEFVGEINGRANTRQRTPPVGTESRAAMRVGARFTKGTVRLDTGVVLGMTSRDPSIGLTVGFTYVFNAFTIP